jgi:AcrR family transcriptional regulator
MRYLHLGNRSFTIGNRVITSTPAPTRERILSAAIDLFGRQGYHGTSVGEIETAAGLVPRSGGLYKHFPSKAALLDAAIESRTGAVAEVEAAVEAAAIEDPRAHLRLLGRLALDEIGKDQAILRIVMREGDNFPELRDDFHRRIVSRGQAKLVADLRATALRRGVDPPDLDAVAAVALGPIINYRVLETLFGRPPGDVDEDRFIEAWADAHLARLAEHGLIDKPPDKEPRT